MSFNIKRLLNLIKAFQLSNLSVVNDGFVFQVNNLAVGMIRRKEWNILKVECDGIFRCDESRKIIHLDKWKTNDEITNNLGELLEKLRKIDAFPSLRGWRNELYEVGNKFGEPLFRIERAASFIFGIKRYGVDVNGYVESDGKIQHVWLQRRSKTKEQFPDLLDNFVGGGLEAGLSPAIAVVKECFEEASVPKEFCLSAVKSTGIVSYVYENEFGTHPEVSFVHDARLPADFTPKSNDGEVDEFVKVSVNELLDLIVDPSKFKITSVPIVLDFLIRKHVIDCSYGADLLEIVETIHQPLHGKYPLS